MGACNLHGGKIVVKGRAESVNRYISNLLEFNAI